VVVSRVSFQTGEGAQSTEKPSGYTVKRGDTLSAIAKAFNVPLADVMKANPQITNANRIYPGDIVRLPAPGTTSTEVEASREPRRAAGSGMAGVGGLSPQTYLGARGVTPPLSTRSNGSVEIPTLPVDFPASYTPVTAGQLKMIMPGARDEDVAAFLVPLNRAMAEYGINTAERKAAFIGQIAVESGQLRYRHELASGEAYEGRAGLGNTSPGDGPRYKGRGLIQLTGRANYKRLGKALGLALEDDPDLAALPENSANIAAYYFSSRGLNALADAGNFREITRRVNGGFNGLEARTRFYNSGLATLA